MEGKSTREPGAAGAEAELPNAAVHALLGLGYR
jgi:hypothetical protein